MDGPLESCGDHIAGAATSRGREVGLMIAGDG
jgi:hypothetical protein